jgi:hypothetical protein
MAPRHSPKTLQQAIKYYSDPDVCQQTLADARWPGGVECPHCGSKEVGYLGNQRRWQCKAKPYHAKRQFSVKVGTIFEDSPIGLDKWFVAIWLIDNAKNGISSYELSRAIGITQKSAWFVLHRVRLAMQTKTFAKLSGDVEIDETYIGRKARNMHKGHKERMGMHNGASHLGKVAVMGLLNRHSKDGHSTVRVEVLGDIKKHNVQGRVREHVESGANIYTDDYGFYCGLHGELHPRRHRPRSTWTARSTRTVARISGRC